MRTTKQTPTQRGRHTPHLLATLLACHLLLLTGCGTTFSPSSLLSYTEDVTTVRIEPTGKPEIRLTPHSDGLGWTVRVLVSERVHQDVVVKEIWEGKQLKVPFHPIVVELFGLLCPIGIVSGVAGGITNPGIPSWVGGFEYCVGGLTHKGEIAHVHDTQTMTDRVLYRQRPETTGHVQLQWQEPHHNPLMVEVQIQEGSEGTVVRIPWLAEAMRRNGRPLDTTLKGVGHIIYEGPNNVRAISALTITSDTLRAASSQMLWRAPDDLWPRRLHVRLGMEQTPRNSHTPPAPIGLIAQRLIARQIQVVAREDVLDQVITTQRQQLQPSYRDTAPSPGHLTAATVLLHIATYQKPQSRQVTATAVAIDSGLVLGTVTLEDQDHQWDRFMESLASLLPDLLAPDATRREGWLIR